MKQRDIGQFTTLAIPGTPDKDVNRGQNWRL